MKKLWLVIALMLMALAVGTSGALATSIPINNYSFESPVVASWNENIVTDWVSTGVSGVQRPQSWYLVTGIDQNQVAWIHTGSISQELIGTTIQAGLTYNLSALVGTWVTSGTAPTYNVELVDYNNSVVLADATGQPSLTSNQLVQVSTSYTANAAAYYGNTLEIVLSNTGQEINMDKVNLTTVPLPPSLLLMGSGLLGLGLFRFRRKA
ncbi:MAG: hypothetical protein ACLQLE_02985 [Desulfobaccales bacterium]